VLPVCRELGIGFVPFSPLGRAFLSGTVTDLDALSPDDMRRRLPRFQGENLSRNLALARRLEDIASRRAGLGEMTNRRAGPIGPAGHRCTAAQLALAWLLAKGTDVGTAIVPIPGTKRRVYVEENAAAVDLELSPTDVRELDGIFSPEAVAGARYTEAMARLVDTST